MSEIDALKARVAAQEAFIRGLARTFSSNAGFLQSLGDLQHNVLSEIQTSSDSPEYEQAVRGHVSELLTYWPNQMNML